MPQTMLATVRLNGSVTSFSCRHKGPPEMPRALQKFRCFALQTMKVNTRYIGCKNKKCFISGMPAAEARQNLPEVKHMEQQKRMKSCHIVLQVMETIQEKILFLELKKEKKRSSSFELAVLVSRGMFCA